MQDELQKNVDRWRGDFKDYCEKNLWIITKKALLEPFIFNRMQKRLWILLYEQMKLGIPIRWLIVKDRQLGCSTFICAFIFWLISLFSYKGALQINYDADSASGLFDKIKLFFKKLPAEMKPMRKVSNRRELYYANPDDEGPLGLESRVRIDTADTDDPGVSYTLCAVHLSEMGIWQDMGLDIKKRMGALNQAIPEEPGTFIFNETTPRGEGYVKDMWDDPDNGYTKIFLSSVCDERYRKEISPSEYFELTDYSEHLYGDETEEFEYYEDEVKFWYPEFKPDTIDGKEKIYHEVMCRLAWRREMIVKKCERDKLLFDQEYPITIEKAFAASGANIFNAQQLSSIKKVLKANPPKFARYRFDDTPIKNDKGKVIRPGDFYNSDYGPLRVYLPPDPKHKFIIGGDGAMGVKDGDSSALVGRRIPDLKLAFAYHETIDPFTFSKIAYTLCLLYNNAFIGLERNERGGFASVEYLLNHWIYLNQYKSEVWGKIGDPQTEKYGWATTKSTKPTMIADLREHMRNGTVELIDVETVDQLLKYKKLPNGLTGAVTGFDDLAIAEMICLQMAKYVNDFEVPEAKKTKWTLDWWANTLDQQVSTEGLIGYQPRGGSIS